jgi:hypothetical protein
MNAMPAPNPVPPPLAALSREAFQAVEATGGSASFGGMALYNPAKDSMIQTLPSYQAALDAMCAPPLVTTRYGAKAQVGDRLTLQFVYQLFPALAGDTDRYGTSGSHAGEASVTAAHCGAEQRWAGSSDRLTDASCPRIEPRLGQHEPGTELFSNSSDRPPVVRHGKIAVGGDPQPDGGDHKKAITYHERTA